MAVWEAVLLQLSSWRPAGAPAPALQVYCQRDTRHQAGQAAPAAAARLGCAAAQLGRDVSGWTPGWLIRHARCLIWHNMHPSSAANLPCPDVQHPRGGGEAAPAAAAAGQGGGAAADAGASQVGPALPCGALPCHGSVLPPGALHALHVRNAGIKLGRACHPLSHPLLCAVQLDAAWCHAAGRGEQARAGAVRRPRQRWAVHHPHQAARVRDPGVLCRTAWP